MKKLLFITYSLWKRGGVQTVLVNLINELSQEYDITVLCLDGYDEFVYDLDPKIKSVVLNSFGDTKPYKAMEFMDEYFSWLPKKQNIKNYIYQYGVYLLLRKWLKENQQNYDTIVTCRYMLSSMLSTMKGINKKTYTWEHTNYKGAGYFWGNIMRPYYKNLKGIIHINNESGDYYKKLNPNTILIRNIIGEPYEGTPYISSEEKENTILFVGRLHPEKNTRELAEIFFKLKDPKQWKLKIVGDGEDRRHLENFIQENQISNIFLLGNKNKEEVYQNMKKSKILVLTSNTEGLPTVLIESMFCSNILVSYNCEFGPANIINENNGFLVKPHDKQTFGEKLQVLIDNEELVKKINKTAYIEAQKWKKEAILNQWKQIL